MIRKAILGTVIAVLVLAVGGIVAWYWYDGDHFVTTDDARIAANLVTISP